jgi:hypothetical protein
LGDPISEWVNEIELFGDAIEQSVDHAKQPKDVQLGYATPEQIQKYIFDREWTNAVVLDYTQFGATVTAFELASIHQWLAQDCQNQGQVDHVIDHYCRCPIIGPGPRIVERTAGMPDGKITTNLGGSMANMFDTDHTITSLKLDKFCKGWLINGDDIGMLFSTLITPKNLADMAKQTTRVLNPDKCVISNEGAWFSKVCYFEDYFCKPAMLVLNSTIFKEHESDPLTGTAAYMAVAIAQQVEWLKDHPNGESIARMIKRCDKHPIETIPDDERKEAEQVYLAKHNWMEDAGQEDSVAALATGFYASISA